LKQYLRDSAQYSSKIIERIVMKDTIEILNYLITNETQSIEKMLCLYKEDKLTILRLQNKLETIKKEIEEHKQLTKEYRNYLRNMPKITHTGTKLNPTRKSHSDTTPSITRIKLVGKLEKQV
jgi:hypothetical protein